VDLHDADPHRSAQHRLGWVLLFTAGFMAVEFAAALFIGSLALLADAGHMLRDVMGLAIAFVAAMLADQPTDARATYGYRRCEVLGTFINGLLLTGMIVFIFGESARRFIQPEGVQAWPMLVIGLLGLMVNLAGIWLLRGDAKVNMNLRGAYLEVLADALGSVGVVVAAVIIMLTGWTYADAVVALAIALWMIPRTWTLLRDAGRILLEFTPVHADLEQIEAGLADFEEVNQVHDLHVWSTSDGTHLLSVHLEVAPLSAKEQLRLLHRAHRFAEDHGISHATIQLEPGTFKESFQH